jgi:HK97 family phage major capsid protein
MSLTHITEQVNQLGTAWEQFKQVNNQRLNEIERKGNADPLYAEHLAKINTALDHHKSRMNTLETSMHRPAVAAEGFKENSPYQGEYKKAFTTYLRKGMDAGLENLESKALSVGSDPDGGYTVTPAMSETIVKAVNEFSPIRQLANVETISTDAFEIIQDYDEAAAGWTTETGAVSDSNTPQIAKKTITVHELYAQPKATQKLVDDSAIDIEQWLSEKVSEVFTRLENKAFVDGDGTSQPKGILTYAAGTSWGQIEQVDSGTNGALTADGLIALYYSLQEEYASNATFLMNRSVVQAARLLKETNSDQYLWQP